MAIEGVADEQNIVKLKKCHSKYCQKILPNKILSNKKLQKRTT
jgi:hypothetical protein